MKEITEKKFKALSNEQGGVQINSSRDGVKVATRDTPLVTGKGKTLDEAMESCWNRLMDQIEYFAKWNPAFYAESMAAKKQRLLSTVGEV